MSEYIAPYVLLDDYKCSHCGQLPPDIYINGVYSFLFDHYGRVVEAFGREPKISCGYRCHEYNTTIPGASPISVHIFGLALDVDLNGAAETRGFAQVVDEIFPQFRMGVYATGGKSFVHVDVGWKITPRITRNWREGARW